MEISLGQIAELVGGRILRGDPATVYRALASLDAAEADGVSFFGNPRYTADLAKTKAGVVLLADEGAAVPADTALVLVENAVTAFDVLVRRYGAPPPDVAPGVHPSAVVADEVALDADKVSIGPLVSIGSGSTIGDGTQITAGAVIGAGCVLGKDCRIAGNVTIREGTRIGDRVIIHGCAVIGGDGFGFEFVDGRHQKIEQAGIVRIEDDVEIGSGTTIDRARFGETVIGEGTKIDNQVQIAHNVVIGKHCIIVAQCGISGSARIGDYVTLAAKVGVAGHLSIGDRATIGGDSGVITDVPEGETWFGYPAKPIKMERRRQMHVKRLGSFFDRVRVLEERLNERAGRGEEGS